MLANSNFGWGTYFSSEHTALLISKLATSEILIVQLVSIAEKTGCSHALSETLKTGLSRRCPYFLYDKICHKIIYMSTSTNFQSISYSMRNTIFIFGFHNSDCKNTQKMWLFLVSYQYQAGGRGNDLCVYFMTGAPEYCLSKLTRDI